MTPAPPSLGPAASGVIRIGVLSDTHNHFDPRLPEVFAAVDHILHGGDIGQPQIILQLERIAPVTAVAGNTDDPSQARETETIELAGRRFLLQHIVDPHHPAPELARRLAREQPDVVVFGHTHRRCWETLGTTGFLNPGYAGRPRLGLARSVVVLHCGPQEMRPEFIELG